MAALWCTSTSLAFSPRSILCRDRTVPARSSEPKDHDFATVVRRADYPLDDPNAAKSLTDGRAGEPGWREGRHGQGGGTIAKKAARARARWGAEGSGRG